MLTLVAARPPSPIDRRFSHQPSATSHMERATCTLPHQGCLLALDVGDRRAGIAVSDELQMLAAPLTVLTRRSRRDDAQRLGNIAGERTVVGLVVGLPLHADGSESQ
ncbi:MAG: Holliday junction resolvase RuvX [Caldilineales bacterium]